MGGEIQLISFNNGSDDNKTYLNKKIDWMTRTRTGKEKREGRREEREKENEELPCPAWLQEAREHDEEGDAQTYDRHGIRVKRGARGVSVIQSRP